jgi:hypothetical protein
MTQATKERADVLVGSVTYGFVVSGAAGSRHDSWSRKQIGSKLVGPSCTAATEAADH